MNIGIDCKPPLSNTEVQIAYNHKGCLGGTMNRNTKVAIFEKYVNARESIGMVEDHTIKNTTCI